MSDCLETKFGGLVMYEGELQAVITTIDEGGANTELYSASRMAGILDDIEDGTLEDLSGVQKSFNEALDMAHNLMGKGEEPMVLDSPEARQEHLDSVEAEQLECGAAEVKKPLCGSVWADPDAVPGVGCREVF